MSQTWQLQTAKNKFSQVVNQALQSGPQIITRRGVKTAVVISFEDYRRLLASRKKLSTFSASLLWRRLLWSWIAIKALCGKHSSYEIPA